MFGQWIFLCKVLKTLLPEPQPLSARCVDAQVTNTPPPAVLPQSRHQAILPPPPSCAPRPVGPNARCISRLGYCPVHQARARLAENASSPAPAGLSPHELGAEISGFVVKRRHHATPQHTLEALFTAVPRVDKLHLPPGVYIPAETAAQMGVYALLPELFYLEGSALDARPILAMARSRHALFLAAAPGPDEDSEFEEGSSQQPMRSLGPPTTIDLLVPRDRPADEKAAVVAEAQALGMLGIACTILSTDMLPLPVIDPRELMGSRLLAWVKGVPKEYLKI
ncbi:hypothetical protein BJ912DRAFT_382905 [Pholiota molesta]|nr:hypothetical protein BJ912DRAFT_382905 [Pholiota molesta]